MRAVPAVVGGQLRTRRPSLELIFGSDKLLVSDSFISLCWTYSQIIRSGRQVGTYVRPEDFIHKL